MNTARLLRSEFDYGKEFVMSLRHHNVTQPNLTGSDCSKVCASHAYGDQSLAHYRTATIPFSI